MKRISWRTILPSLLVLQVVGTEWYLAAVRAGLARLNEPGYRQRPDGYDFLRLRLDGFLVAWASAGLAFFPGLALLTLAMSRRTKSKALRVLLILIAVFCPLVLIAGALYWEAGRGLW